MAASQPPYDIQAVLRHTNAYRSKHQANAVVHDPSISKISQAWSDHLATNVGSLQHNSELGRRGYGENLAQGWASGNATSEQITSSINMLIDLWYNEVSLYDHRNPVYTPGVGHFTQLVWQSTTKIGVGVSIGNGMLFLAMNYDPPGNYAGRFDVNVQPAT